MAKAVEHDLAEVTSHFTLGGPVTEVAPYGSGHINDTYLSEIRTDGGPRRFIHQRINHEVFKDPGDHVLLIMGRHDDPQPAAAGTRRGGGTISPSPQRNKRVVPGDRKEDHLCRLCENP